MQYTIKPGDSLSKIARDVLGDISLWPKIAQLNNITNPNLIYPGQTINIDVKPQQATSKAWLWWLVLIALAAALIWAIRKNKIRY